MSEWIPPGYISVVSLVREHGIDQVRSDLVNARLQAFGWEESNGHLYPLEPTAWCRRGAEEYLRTGGWPHGGAGPSHSVLVRVGEKTKPQPSTDGVYLSPFLRMMMEAVRHFEISEDHWPKKQELEQYFAAQKLPDGTPVSLNQARALATFCRPLEAMSGGNKG